MICVLILTYGHWENEVTGTSVKYESVEAQSEAENKGAEPAAVVQASPNGDPALHVAEGAVSCQPGNTTEFPVRNWKTLLNLLQHSFR